MGRFKLAIIIPAFNEEKTIANIVKGAKKYGHVIVIDDNSNDKTAIIARNYGAEVLSNKTQKGYSYTLNKGIKIAQARKFLYLISLDADGEHRTQEIPRLINEFEKGFELVFGIRKKKQRFSEVIFCKYFDLVFGVKDILCGMKGLKLSKINLKKINFIKNDMGLSIIFTLLKKKIKFSQLEISGKKRKDRPRFGNLFSANFKILISLLKIFLESNNINFKLKKFYGK